MKPRYLALAMFGLALALPLLAVEQPSVKPIEKPLAKSSVVPFELLKSGHMAVMVKVNGKGPYRVIFDTGAPINLFNNKLAKETGLLKGKPQSSLPLFGTIGEASVKELQVGTEKAADQPAIVMDHPLLEVMSKKLGPLYGIVGFPFFARYKMTLDYQAQTLTLVPSGYKPANTMASLENTLMQLMLGGPPEPRLLSAAGQWGLVAHKPAGEEDAGVIVKEVLPGSAAAAAGLKPGDRLLTLDERWTDTLADLYEAASRVQSGTTVPLRIRRDGTEMEVKVTPRPGL
jgi:hypothetical protein